MCECGGKWEWRIDGEESDCYLVIVSVLTWLSASASVLVCAAELFSKRSASVLLASCQTKKVRMNVEVPPVKAVPEAVTNRPTSENRAPPAPEWTLPHAERKLARTTARA